MPKPFSIFDLLAHLYLRPLRPPDSDINGVGSAAQGDDARNSPQDLVDTWRSISPSSGRPCVVDRLVVQSLQRVGEIRTAVAIGGDAVGYQKCEARQPPRTRAPVRRRHEG